MTFFERSEAARVYQKALRSEAAASEEQEKEEKERRTSAIRLGPKRHRSSCRSPGPGAARRQKALRSEGPKVRSYGLGQEWEKEERERRTSAIRLGPKPVTFFEGSHEVEEPS